MTSDEFGEQNPTLSERDLLGYDLSMARDNLRDTLVNPDVAARCYEDHLASYFNVLYSVHFDPSQSSPSVGELPHIVHAEISILLKDETIFTVDEIAEHAASKLSRDAPRYNPGEVQRAFAYTLLDLIEVSRALPISN